MLGLNRPVEGCRRLPRPLSADTDPVIIALEKRGAAIWWNEQGEVFLVDFKGIKATDAELSYLKGMTRLEASDLSETMVRDAGLTQLKV